MQDVKPETEPERRRREEAVQRVSTTTDWESLVKTLWLEQRSAQHQFHTQKIYQGSRDRWNERVRWETLALLIDLMGDDRVHGIWKEQDREHRLARRQWQAKKRAERKGGIEWAGKL